jgi:hypothetical protein
VTNTNLVALRDYKEGGMAMRTVRTTAIAGALVFIEFLAPQAMAEPPHKKPPHKKLTVHLSSCTPQNIGKFHGCYIVPPDSNIGIEVLFSKEDIEAIHKELNETPETPPK